MNLVVNPIKIEIMTERLQSFSIKKVVKIQQLIQFGWMLYMHKAARSNLLVLWIMSSVIKKSLEQKNYYGKFLKLVSRVSLLKELTIRNRPTAQILWMG